MNLGVDLWDRSWSGLSSAAALMGLAARRTGTALTQPQRERIAWEIDKYAPAFHEMSGESVVASAERAIEHTMRTASTFEELVAAARMHGGRLLTKRDRGTLGWAVCAAVRTAAMERPLDDYDVHFFHEVLHRSRGAYTVEGAFGQVELGELDGLRHQKDPKGFDALLVAPDPAQSRFHVGELGKRPGLPPRAHSSRGRAFAFLTCGALNVGHDGAPKPAAVELAGKLHAMAQPMGFADAPLTPQDHALARELALRSVPNDPMLFLRSWEDHLSWFVDLPRDRQDMLLKSLNALVADAAEVTTYRRELITVAMAVLALGRAAAWRPRSLPPPGAFGPV